MLRLEEDGFLASRTLKKDKLSPELTEALKHFDLNNEKFKLIGWSFHPCLLNTIKFRLVALREHF